MSTASVMTCRKCGETLGSSYLYTADGFSYHHACFPVAPRDAEIARLQEQVETLTIQLRVVKLDRDGAVKRMCGAEAERDRLREMTLRAADQCDKWVKETYDGGWSTHQVRGQCALAESLRLAALQKEPQT